MSITWHTRAQNRALSAIKRVALPHCNLCNDLGFQQVGKSKAPISIVPCECPMGIIQTVKLWAEDEQEKRYAVEEKLVDLRSVLATKEVFK